MTEKSSYRIWNKFAYLFSAHWIRELLQTAFMIYLARKYSATFGEFSLALNVGYIVRFIAECGLNQHLATMLARKSDYPTTLLAQFTILKGGILGLSLLGMLGFVFWQDYDPSLRLLVILIGTAVGLEALNSSFFVVYQILGRQDVEGRLRSAGSIAGFGYGLLSLFFNASPLLIALFKPIETAVNLFGSCYGVLSRLRLRLDMAQLRLVWDTWKQGFVFTLMAVLAIFYNKINVFFLQNSAGAEAVAQYSVAWQTVDGISTMVSAMLLGKVMFPIFAKLWFGNRSEFGRLAQRSGRWLLVAGLILGYALAIESDRIILAIYGTQYQDAIWMQQYLAPAILFAFMHNLAAYLMISAQCQVQLLLIYIVGLAVNLALCILIIPGSPLLGTTLAIVLTKGFVAVLSVGFSIWRYRMLDGRSLLHLGLTGLAGLALYAAGRELLFREAAELLGLLPTLWLALRWRKGMLATRQEVTSGTA